VLQLSTMAKLKPKGILKDFPYPQKNYMIDTFLFIRRRVEDWRVGVGRILYSLLTRPSVCECHNISAIPRLQSQARQTQHVDFPHYAFLYASYQGLCDL